MDYPTIAIINAQEYEINTDYRVALTCMQVVEDDISDIERAYAIIGLLFDEEIDNDSMNEALTKAIKFLQCGEEVTNNTTTKKDMDFEQDKAYIMSSFFADYKIDLSEVKEMHWWKFCDLISGLSSECILNRVRDIRNYDINEIKDPKEKSKLMKAKESVALKDRFNDEEQKVIDEFEALFK
jgi:hypothetical protein